MQKAGRFTFPDSATRLPWRGRLAFSLFLLGMPTIIMAQKEPDRSLTQMPAGYHLQVYDDCGEPARQPHVLHRERCHTFGEGAVDADLPARTVTYGTPHFEMVFTQMLHVWISGPL